MTENDRHLIKIVLILITHIIEYSNIIKDQYYDNVDSKSNNSTYYKLQVCEQKTLNRRWTCGLLSD